MTYLEKFRLEHPEFKNWTTDDLTRYSDICPENFNEPFASRCPLGMSCSDCWNREIPDTEPTDKKEKKKMTCREKLMEEHPEKIMPERWGGCIGCPHDYGYLDRDPSLCGNFAEGCVKCWNRELPEKKDMPAVTVAIETDQPVSDHIVRAMKVAYDAIMALGVTSEVAKQQVLDVTYNHIRTKFNEAIKGEKK